MEYDLKTTGHLLASIGIGFFVVGLIGQQLTTGNAFDFLTVSIFGSFLKSGLLFIFSSVVFGIFFISNISSNPKHIGFVFLAGLAAQFLYQPDVSLTQFWLYVGTVSSLVYGGLIRILE